MRLDQAKIVASLLFCLTFSLIYAIIVGRLQNKYKKERACRLEVWIHSVMICFCPKRPKIWRVDYEHDRKIRRSAV